MTDTQKKQLLNQLDRIECQLSPENLSCDGELSRAQIIIKAKRLNNERAEILKELRNSTIKDL